MPAGYGWRGGVRSALAALVLILMLIVLLAGCGARDHPFGTQGDPTGASETPSALTTGTASSLPLSLSAAATNLSSYPGGFMTMTVVTAPYALCTFTVAYNLGAPSSSLGIVPITADAAGKASWRWQVDVHAHTGVYPLTISAVLPSGDSISAVVHVAVTLPPITIVSSGTALSGLPKQALRLEILTAPGATCTLLLSFGASKPVKPLPTHADSSGMANWTWIIDGQAAPGTYREVIIVALQDGETTSTQVNMVVR